VPGLTVPQHDDLLGGSPEEATTGIEPVYTALQAAA
jgi:hypothetical protein